MALDPNERIHERIAALEELMPWMESLAKSPRSVVLERAEGAAFHKVMGKGNALYLLADDGKPSTLNLEGFEDAQVFVVQHNWAAAFSGAQDFLGGEFRLPYETCCFEFRVSGRRVCLMVKEKDEQQLAAMLVETRKVWVMPSLTFDIRDAEKFHVGPGTDKGLSAVAIFLAQQIKAICVSLEAQVADTEIVPAHPKLNTARLRRGKPPLPDYRVIRLNKGPRTVTPAGDGEAQSKRRLHFRRGHWRHLVGERRTWVRWHLVGDPDLGFIDHEYRL